MSDTFDHEADAWDSYDQSLEDSDSHSSRRSRMSRTTTSYRKPPSYTALPVVLHLASTKRADLVVITLDGVDRERWLPKSKTIFKYADMIQVDDWLLLQIRKEIEKEKANA